MNDDGKLYANDVMIGSVGELHFSPDAEVVAAAVPFRAPIHTGRPVTIRAVEFSAEALEANATFVREMHRKAGRNTLEVTDPLTGRTLAAFPVYRTTFDGTRAMTLHLSPRRFYRKRHTRMAGK